MTQKKKQIYMAKNKANHVLVTSALENVCDGFSSVTATSKHRGKKQLLELKRYRMFNLGKARQGKTRWFSAEAEVIIRVEGNCSRISFTYPSSSQRRTGRILSISWQSNALCPCPTYFPPGTRYIQR